MSTLPPNTPGTQQQPQDFDTLFKLARQHAAAKPDALAYTYLPDGETEEENLTYRELDAQARAIAGRLQSLCRPGEHVLLLQPQGLSFVVSFIACQYAGVTPVPAYPPDPLRANRTLPRLQAIVSDCGAALALGTGESLGWLGADGGQQLGLRQTLATDAWQDWAGLPWTAPELLPDQVCWLQYTSGSTATPRGVMVTHGNLPAQFEYIRFLDNEASTGVSWLPMFHDLGLMGGLLLPLWYGRRAVLMSPLAFVQRPMRWLLALSRYRGYLTGAPNFAFDLIVNKFVPQEAAGLDLSSLRIMMTGAEHIRAETLDRFSTTLAPYGLRPDIWWPSYGLAEATLGVTAGHYRAQAGGVAFSVRELEKNRAVPVATATEPARRLVGCGPAIHDTEVVIADPARRMELPAGQVGEVWVRGPSVALGYWKQPQETEAVFHARLADSGRGPFLRTGDLGFLHEGQLYLTGRLKEVMVFWGRNVYPQDVEQTAWSCHPLLRENTGAAFAVEADGREQLALVLEVARPGKLNLDAVADAIRHAIQGEHHVPLYALVFIKSGTLPKTTSGKTQRHLARERFLANELTVLREWRYPTAGACDAGAAPPERDLPTPGEISVWLVARIARQCNLPEDQVDPEQPIQRYVVDSVSAVTLATELQQWLGRSLSPVLLYDNPPVSVLARRLADPLSYAAGGLPSPAAVDTLSPSELDQALSRLLGGDNAGAERRAD